MVRQQPFQSERQCGKRHFAIAGKHPQFFFDNHHAAEIGDADHHGVSVDGNSERIGRLRHQFNGRARLATRSFKRCAGTQKAAFQQAFDQPMHGLLRQVRVTSDCCTGNGAVAAHDIENEALILAGKRLAVEGLARCLICCHGLG